MISDIGKCIGIRSDSENIQERQIIPDIRRSEDWGMETSAPSVEEPWNAPSVADQARLKNAKSNTIIFSMVVLKLHESLRNLENKMRNTEERARVCHES